MALEVVKVKKCIKIGTIIGYCIMMLIIGIYIGSMHPKIGNITQEQRFDIFQSYSFTSGDYKDTTISFLNKSIQKHNNLMGCQPYTKHRFR